MQEAGVYGDTFITDPELLQGADKGAAAAPKQAGATHKWPPSGRTVE